VVESGAGRYRWTILAVGCVAQVLYGGLVMTAAVLAPALRNEFHLSLHEIGAALAAVQAGSTLTLIAWGLLSDRVGERLVIVTGTAGTAVALVGAAYAPSAWLFILALGVAGMTAAGIASANGRAVMMWFGPQERGLALGIRQTAGMMGQAAAAGILPTLDGAFGLATAFDAVAGYSVIAGLAALFWMRERPLQRTAGVGSAGPLRDARIWKVSLGSSLLIVTQISITGFVVLYLHDERHLSPGAAGAVLAAISIGGGLLRIVVGHWSDKLGDRLAPMRIVTMGIFASLALIVAATYGPIALVVAAMLVGGTLAVLWNGLSYAAVAELAGPGRAGAALGLQQTVLGIMGAVTPIAFAASVSLTSWTYAFALLGVFPVLAYPFFRGGGILPHEQEAPVTALT
jgi:MFS family permease